MIQFTSKTIKGTETFIIRLTAEQATNYAAWLKTNRPSSTSLIHMLEETATKATKTDTGTAPLFVAWASTATWMCEEANLANV